MWCPLIRTASRAGIRSRSNNAWSPTFDCRQVRTLYEPDGPLWFFALRPQLAARRAQRRTLCELGHVCNLRRRPCPAAPPGNESAHLRSERAARCIGSPEKESTMNFRTNFAALLVAAGSLSLAQGCSLEDARSKPRSSGTSGWSSRPMNGETRSASSTCGPVWWKRRLFLCRRTTCKPRAMGDRFSQSVHPPKKAAT